MTTLNALFQNNYTIGKGRLYFSRFVSDDNRVPLTPLKYFGNTPSFESQRTVTSLDHYDSDIGQKIKDDSFDIQTELAGKFTCDNITGDNMALFYGGTNTPIMQAAGSTPLTEVIAAVPDSYFQIGVTAALPAGLRGVTGFTITTGGSTAVDPSTYDFDPASGLLYIHSTVTAASWTLSYTLAAGTQGLVTESGVAIFGRLLFVSNNPKGQQRDYLFPYVKIMSDAAMPLKGDTWLTMSFGWEAFQLNPQTQRVYATQR